MRGGGGIDRCFEIVAKGGAKRGFVALSDSGLFSYRRPEAARSSIENFGKRCHLGFELLGFTFGLSGRFARVLVFIACQAVIMLGCRGLLFACLCCRKGALERGL